MFDNIFGSGSSSNYSSKSSSRSCFDIINKIEESRRDFDDGLITGIIKGENRDVYINTIERKMKEDGPDYRRKAEERQAEKVKIYFREKNSNNNGEDLIENMTMRPVINFFKDIFS